MKTFSVFFLYFQLETIEGETIMIQRDDGDLKIISEEGAANVKFGDIETTFGLVHIIDSVLI